MREIFITDLHGNYTKTMNLLKSVNWDINKDRLIIGGDYFDRGLENSKMAMWLQEIYNHENVVLLRGNHDIAMLYLLEYNSNDEDFMMKYREIQNMIVNNGMDKTVKQLLGSEYKSDVFMTYEEIRNIINKRYPKLLNAMRSTKWYYESDIGIYTHAKLPRDYKTLKNIHWYGEVWADSVSWANTNPFPNLSKNIYIGHFTTRHVKSDYTYDGSVKINNIVFCDGNLAFHDGKGLIIVDGEVF